MKPVFNTSGMPLGETENRQILDSQSTAESLLAGGFTGDPSKPENASPFLKKYLPPEKKDYSQDEIAKAAFERENTIYSKVASLLNGEDLTNEEDPNFDPVDFVEENIRNTEYAPYWQDFLQLRNSSDAQKVLGKIDRENKNTEILSESGLSGFSWGMAAGIFDPVNLIPVGGSAYKAFKAGKLAKGIAATSGAAALSVGASEGILQAEQITRTPEESAVNIAGGAVLGGILGGASALLSKKQFNKLAKSVENDLQSEKSNFEIDPNTQQIKPSEPSVGARKVVDYNDLYLKHVDEETKAGRTPLEYKDFQNKMESLASVFGGKTATRIADKLSNVPYLGSISDKVRKSLSTINRINPTLRILNSDSTTAKTTFQDLSTSSMLMAKNEAGIASQQEVEVAVKQWRAGLGESILSNNDSFKSFKKKIKKEGNQNPQFQIKNKADWNKQVSFALRNGDKHPIPEVEQAARTWRSKVFDPLKNEAITNKLLPADVKPETAVSYLTRLWNRKMVIGFEKELRGIIENKLRNHELPKLEKTSEEEIKNLKAKVEKENTVQKDEVIKGLEKQIVETGRISPESAAFYTDTLGSFYNTQLERLGHNEKAKNVLKDFFKKLKITAGDSKDADGLFQSGLDVIERDRKIIVDVVDKILKQGGVEIKTSKQGTNVFNKLNESQKLKLIDEQIGQINKNIDNYLKSRTLFQSGESKNPISDLSSIGRDQEMLIDVIDKILREGGVEIKTSKQINGNLDKLSESQKLKLINEQREQIRKNIDDYLKSRTLFQSGEAKAPAFYSALEKQITDLPQGKGSPEQWAGIIKNLVQKGVKQEEIDWLGLEDWIKQQKETVTKQQILDYIKANKLEITEVDKNTVENAKFSHYTVEGGGNYHELLLTLPEKIKSKKPYEQWLKEDWNGEDILGMSPREIYDTLNESNSLYTSSHYKEKNIVSHLRFDERVDKDGKRVMFVEEIQSDWHQDGRKKGYKNNNPVDELNAVPDAPFKTSWPDLAFKRAMLWAVENNYDRIAWTNGDQQAARYGLSNNIDKIVVGINKEDNSIYYQGFSTKEGANSFPKIIKPITKEQLPSEIGKELAAKAIAELESGKSGNKVTYEGLNLKFGGEGMRAFYDKMLPASVNKLVKKFDGKVEMKDVAEVGNVHTLEITPKMRESIQQQGLPLFQSEKRGSIQFETPTGETIIKLFEKSDSSTLLHESAHFFLETQKAISQLDGLPKQIKDDWNSILKWLGSEDGNFTREQHEKFAEGFENYLKTGNAPSSQLRQAFEAFKVWLVKIYNQLKGSDVKVSKDVEDLFGRMLATDEQISNKGNKNIEDKLNEKLLEHNQYFADTATKEDYIKDIVDSVLSNLKGESRFGSTTNYDFKVTKRGPLKERTLNFIQDNEVEKFLENDIEMLADRYTRIMGTDVELARKFDGDVNLEGRLRDVQEEYKDLASKAETAEEAKRIQKQKESVIRDLKSLRDIQRGIYAQPENPDSLIVRSFRVGRHLNYATKLGGVVISSISDCVRPVMIHGFGRFSKGLGHVMTNLKGIKMNIAEARRAGNIWENVLHSRIATLAEISDPYSSGQSTFEKFISNTAALATKLNGIAIWNDIVKGFSSVLTQQRIIEEVQNLVDGSIAQNNRTYLAFLGIDKDNVNLISSELSKFATKEKGLWIANTDKWMNRDAINLYRNALNKDVDRTIVTKNSGDVPLFMNTELGKTIGQFKSFTFASTQQVLIAGLQQKDSAALQGMITAISMGALTYYLKTIAAGKEPSTNPNKWIVEGIDRSGILGIIMEANNLTEKMTRGTIGINPMIGAETMSRYASRGVVDSLAGPTAGQIKDIAAITGAISTGDIKEEDIKAFRRMIPYQNVFYLNSLFNELQQQLNQNLVNK